MKIEKCPVCVGDCMKVEQHQSSHSNKWVECDNCQYRGQAFGTAQEAIDWHNHRELCVRQHDTLLDARIRDGVQCMHHAKELDALCEIIKQSGNTELIAEVEKIEKQPMDEYSANIDYYKHCVQAFDGSDPKVDPKKVIELGGVAYIIKHIIADWAEHGINSDNPPLRTCLKDGE